MRKFLLLLVFIGLVTFIWAYKYPDNFSSVTGNLSRYVGEKLLHLSNQNLKETVAPKLAPVPEGLFVLTERINIPFASGGGFLEVGTEVRKVGEGNGKIVISDGVRQLIVDGSKITRDAYEIRALKQRQLENANAMARQAREQAAENIRLVEAKIASTRNELAMSELQEKQARASGNPTPYGVNSSFLRNTLIRLETEKKKLEAQATGRP